MSNARSRAGADPRLEALALEALERHRGRAAIQPAPRAGGFASKVLAPLLRDTGASIYELQRHWADIVGERLAGLTGPEKLAGGILTVRAHSSAAPFVQHQAKLIIERANLAGARITGLAIRQGSPPAKPRSNVGPLARPLGPEEEAAIAAALANVSPGRLRDALLRLGRAVASR